ncbi:MAG: sigma-70 family RNA polymerase sigma factor [Oscillospiraceae bacterium]|nr:sigma-70 family RNA polymerase sigma factor [Oscillospiraceae bacterium]
MEDAQIVELYWQRQEQAISATAVKYGAYCHTIAYNILNNREDAEESVSDTWLAAWKNMPPHRPRLLSTFLGKITRRISLTRWKRATRQKRGGGELPLALEELSACLSGGETAEEALERKELVQQLNRFLSQLPETERDIFVSRYWFLAPVKQIAEQFGFTESKVKSMLARTREKLRRQLTQEGLL